MSARNGPIRPGQLLEVRTHDRSLIHRQRQPGDGRGAIRVQIRPDPSDANNPAKQTEPSQNYASCFSVHLDSGHAQPIAEPMPAGRLQLVTSVTPPLKPGSITGSSSHPRADMAQRSVIWPRSTSMCRLVWTASSIRRSWVTSSKVPGYVASADSSCSMAGRSR